MSLEQTPKQDFAQLVQILHKSVQACLSETNTIQQKVRKDYGDYIKSLESKEDAQIKGLDQFTFINDLSQEITDDFNKIKSYINETIDINKYCSFIGNYNSIISNYALICEAYQKLTDLKIIK